MYLRGDKRGLVHQISLEACRLHRKDCTRTENCISIRQPTTAQPTTNRAQSNLFELPGCEGGNRKVTFRAYIHTAYRDRKIKENLDAFLERIETIPTDKDHLSQDEVICLASTESRDTVLFTLPKIKINHYATSQYSLSHSASPLNE